jgi:hypothetical protein
LRKLVYNLVKRRRLDRIQMQAFIHVMDYKVEASYLVKRGVKRVVERGLFKFPYILKSRN